MSVGTRKEPIKETSVEKKSTRSRKQVKQRSTHHTSKASIDCVSNRVERHSDIVEVIAVVIALLFLFFLLLFLAPILLSLLLLLFLFLLFIATIDF